MNLSKESKANLVMELLGMNEMSNKQETNTSNDTFLEIGKVYVVRTITMIYLGELKAINGNELLLTNCAWIPDTSRWNEFLKGENPNEMEPYKNDAIISRGALLDITVMDSKIDIKVI